MADRLIREVARLQAQMEQSQGRQDKTEFHVSQTDSRVWMLSERVGDLRIDHERLKHRVDTLHPQSSPPPTSPSEPPLPASSSAMEQIIAEKRFSMADALRYALAAFLIGVAVARKAMGAPGAEGAVAVVAKLLGLK